MLVFFSNVLIYSLVFAVYAVLLLGYMPLQYFAYLSSVYNLILFTPLQVCCPLIRLLLFQPSV